MKTQHEIVHQRTYCFQNRKLLYRVIRSRKYSEELDWFTTFGMEIENCSTNVHSRLDDISPNYEAVLQFAELCSELGVEPEHLLDTAENFLAELYGGLKVPQHNDSLAKTVCEQTT